MSFRAIREFADLLATSKLNVLDLVENGLMSYCKVPGPKSEMIINGIITIIDRQMAELQERKDELIQLRITAPTITNTSERVISEPAPAPKKFYNLEESLLVRDARNDEEILVSRPQYERNKDIYKLVAEEAEA